MELIILLQVGINHVIYGAGNDRFGGCGSVVPINEEYGIYLL